MNKEFESFLKDTKNTQACIKTGSVYTTFIKIRLDKETDLIYVVSDLDKCMFEHMQPIDSPSTSISLGAIYSIPCDRVVSTSRLVTIFGDIETVLQFGDRFSECANRRADEIIGGRHVEVTERSLAESRRRNDAALLKNPYHLGVDGHGTPKDTALWWFVKDEAPKEYKSKGWHYRKLNNIEGLARALSHWEESVEESARDYIEVEAVRINAALDWMKEANRQYALLAAGKDQRMDEIEYMRRITRAVSNIDNGDVPVRTVNLEVAVGDKSMMIKYPASDLRNLRSWGNSENYHVGFPFNMKRDVLIEYARTFGNVGDEIAPSTVRTITYNKKTVYAR